MLIHIVAIETKKRVRGGSAVSGFITDVESEGDLSGDTFVHFCHSRDSESIPLRLAAFQDVDEVIKKIDKQLVFHKKPAASLKVMPPSDPEEWGKKHGIEKAVSRDPLAAKSTDSEEARLLKAEKRFLRLIKNIWESQGHEVTD